MQFRKFIEMTDPPFLKPGQFLPFAQRKNDLIVWHVTKKNKLESILKNGLKKFPGVYGPAVYCSVNMGERSYGTEDHYGISEDVKPVVLKCDLDITKFIIQGAASEKYGDLAHYIYGNNSLTEQIRNFYPHAPEEWKSYASYPSPLELAEFFSHDPACPGMIINHNMSTEGSWAVVYDPTRLVIKEYAFMETGKSPDQLKWFNAGDVRGLKPDAAPAKPVSKPINAWQARLDSLKTTSQPPKTTATNINKNDKFDNDEDIYLYLKNKLDTK